MPIGSDRPDAAGRRLVRGLATGLLAVIGLALGALLGLFVALWSGLIELSC
ncbi:MAG TPA: hypothetical protein VFR91_06505 [Dyella sp.]|nr:hypothetical protein [Dyella sp.]